jgi:hypothetical protein
VLHIAKFWFTIILSCSICAQDAIIVPFFLPCVTLSEYYFKDTKDEVTHHLEMNYYVNFLGQLAGNEFQLKQKFGTHRNCKNQNPGDRFGATR